MTAAVSALVPALFVAGAEVRVQSMALTLDESWAPYASATLTLPYSPALATALDPRNAPRVQCQLTRQWYGVRRLADLSTAWAGLTLAGLSTAWAGLTLADLTAAWSTPWDSGLRVPDVVTADLAVRARTIDYAQDSITIRAASDELVVQDVTAGGISLPLEPMPDRLYRLLRLAGVPVLASDFTAGAPFIAVPAEVTSWTETLWDAMVRVAALGGLRVWCDNNRKWWLTAALAAPTGTVALPRVSSATDTTNRDGKYANAIVWNGRGVDSGGVPISDTKTWPIPFPSTPRVEVVSKDYGQVGAGLPMPSDLELEARLTQLASQARTLTLTAPADPAVRPGNHLDTGLPSLPVLGAIAASVEWSIPADTMTITTRATEG